MKGRWIVPLAVLLLWHAAVVLTATKIFPSPIAVARGITQLPHLGSYIADSLFRVGAGYLAALIPEQYGGAGLGVTEAAIILEEINRSGGNAAARSAGMTPRATRSL